MYRRKFTPKLSLSFKDVVTSKTELKTKDTSKRNRNVCAGSRTHAHVCKDKNKDANPDSWISFVKKLWNKVPSWPARSQDELPADFKHPDKSMDVAMAICKDYIHQKLQRKGYSTGRTRLYASHCAYSVYFVKAGYVLERLYPKVYTDVSRKIAMTMTSSTVVKNTLTSVLDIMFRESITWGKIVSMFAISASFAEECVQQGHSEFVDDVINCVGNFVALHLVEWLVKQGGWEDFKKIFIGNTNNVGLSVVVGVLTALVGVITTLTVIIDIINLGDPK
ncbi:bcl-2-related ovarian killer protein-like [Gigantopelta aegis]|uniref:bcl-2-related ovarian killer protein-like n=1 Tax=Gigantopelta aegis TaxID=1735272 RepID=UPI001B887680|nr:bcl-2-related ovarian killer protein-like [Gigantopelta aegis]